MKKYPPITLGIMSILGLLSANSNSTDLNTLKISDSNTKYTQCMLAAPTQSAINTCGTDAACNREVVTRYLEIESYQFNCLKQFKGPEHHYSFIEQ